MAEYLHSNDRRKIVNALFKFLKAGYLNGSKNNKESEIAYAQNTALRFLPIIV